MPSRHHRHHRDSHHPPAGVATRDVIREDFEWLTTGTRLRTSRLVEEYILMQSVEGHAHEGHAAFRNHQFANTTMDDIIVALGRDRKLVAQERQALIDDIADWMRRAIAGKTGNLLVTTDGGCLLDIGLFRQIEVEPANVLRGFYVGGLRDDVGVRRRVETKYGVSIGGGAAYLVDIHQMERMNLDARALARGSHEDQIDHYREVGLIIADEGLRTKFSPDRVRYLYVRHRTGGGTSDDAAMLAAGRLFGPSGAIGAFLADAVDTLEKYAARCADQDDDVAAMIGKEWAELGVSEEQLELATYLCATPRDSDLEVPDSSLRHFIEVNRNLDQTAFESHLAYIQGRPHARMKLASEETDSELFYRWFEERAQSSGATSRVA
jgi:hypothetical protein